MGTRELLFTKKDLFQLIAPLIVEQILAVTVGMTDVIMVAFAGEAAVSGVSLVDMINVLILNIFAALATGGAVVSSQFLGARDREKACTSAKQLLIITLVISLAIMALALMLKRSILRLLFGEIDPAVMQNALTFFGISAFSYPFIAMYNSGAALFRSMGNSKISMYTSICMNILNIFGNTILVYIFHFGVAGVATSSLVARTIAAVIMLILVSNKNNSIYINFKEKISFNKSMIQKILHIGIPNALENSLFQLGRVMVVSIIAVFGTVQIAANAVANNLDALGCIPGQALSLAMITVIGHCVGARDYDQAKYYTKRIMKYTYVITGLLNGAILLSLPFVLKIYNLSSETLHLATILVLIHDGCAMLIWPAAFTLPNALRASNDVRFTMVVAIFSMWMFRIVFSYILGKWLGLGAIGVWIAMIMDWVFRSACFVVRFIRGKWKQQYV